ncbi:DUF1622 domain-containing protein [Roseibium sp.]|uniref:DUF1622 domain-containing protein n=1 Tax=Roseibium sp. TaxID=1936156 RepID=UPI003267439F
MPLIEQIANVVDGLAVCVLLTGLVISVVATIRNARTADTPFIETMTGDVLRGFRISLGRWLLTALEILIVSDILHSIAHRTLEEVAFLGGVVAIRILLSYFLDHDIERMERKPSKAGRTEDPLP